LWIGACKMIKLLKKMWCKVYGHAGWYNVDSDNDGIALACTRCQTRYFIVIRNNLEEK
jgi:hypothetical protein